MDGGAAQHCSGLAAKVMGRGSVEIDTAAGPPTPPSCHEHNVDRALCLTDVSTKYR